MSYEKKHTYPKEQSAEIIANLRAAKKITKEPYKTEIKKVIKSIQQGYMPNWEV